MKLSRKKLKNLNQQQQVRFLYMGLQYGLQSQYTSGITGSLGGMAQSQAQQAMNQYNTQADYNKHELFGKTE